jgi:hypothetical protein
MKWTYTVNGVSQQVRPAIATVNGVTVSALVPEVEVELYDPLGQQGSVQLHFRTPDEQAFAKATYRDGATVELDLGALVTAPKA